MRVADTDTQIPGTSSLFAGFSPPSLSGENIAFRAGGGGTTGIFSTFGGLHSVADYNTTIPMGTGTFSFIEGSVSTSGEHVGFAAAGSGGQSGAYLSNGSLSVIADRSTPIPDGSGNFRAFSSLKIRGGKAAFIGYTNPNDPGEIGIYQKSSSAISVVADQATQVPGSATPLTFANYPALAMDDQQVAFTATANIGGGIFTSVGVYSTAGGILHAVADRSTPVPGGTGLMTSFAFDLAADDGIVAFRHSSTDFEVGIAANFDGVLTELVNQDTVIPGAAGETHETFYTFGPIALSGRNLVFGGLNIDESHEGIYALFNNEIMPIIELGDMLDGKIVVDLNFTNEAFDDSQLAFYVGFTDGSSGIYLATIPEPATGFLLLLGVAIGVVRVR